MLKNSPEGWEIYKGNVCKGKLIERETEKRTDRHRERRGEWEEVKGRKGERKGKMKDKR